MTTKNTETGEQTNNQENTMENKEEKKIQRSKIMTQKEFDALSPEKQMEIVQAVHEQMRKNNQFDLNFHVYRLLQSEPFFAALSRTVSKIPTRSIPTAGVRVNPYTCFFELLYNPDFLASLGFRDENGNPIIDQKAIEARREVEIQGLLKHEYYHLIFDHVLGRLPIDVKDPKNSKLAKYWNFATDLAINSYLEKEIPYGGLVPGKYYKDPETGEVDDTFIKYKPFLASEEYYSLLQTDPNIEKKIQEWMKMMGEGEGEGNGNGNRNGQGNKKVKGKGKGRGTLDDHSMWGGEGSENETDPITREIARERLKEAMRQAANESIQGGKGWGTISAEMQKEILEKLKGTVDWKVVLRYFVKVSQKAHKISTMKKINKRFPYIHPGKKNTRTANIAIAIDQSGSVSDGMLAAFFAELNKLSEIATFTVIPFDDHVFKEKVYKWKKGENRKWERVLCGGTNFDAPTDYVNEQNFDGMIVLTDLCAPKPKNCKVQRMWLTVSSCAANPYFKTEERIIIIPDKDHLNE